MKTIGREELGVDYVTGIGKDKRPYYKIYVFVETPKGKKVILDGFPKKAKVDLLDILNILPTDLTNK